MAFPTNIVKVTFEDSNTITTEINGARDTVTDYYRVGKMFNLGSVGDKMVAVKSLEFLAPAPKAPTIYEALEKKLGRLPTTAEIKADCLRILAEGTQEQAAAGQLQLQRKA